jgi:hypothetical protein
MATPLPPHMLDADPAAKTIARYPAPLPTGPLPAHLEDNAIVQLYLTLAPQYEAEFAQMAASDAGDDEAVAAALVASAR